MRKIFTFALGFVIAVSLAACGCSRSDTPSTPTTTPTTAPSTSPSTTIIDPTIMDPTFETNIPDPNVDTSMPESTTNMSDPSNNTTGNAMQ